MKKCIIVIPIHKDNLSDMEVMSLNQIFSFYYNKYEDIDICLAYPNRVNPYKILNNLSFTSSYDSVILWAFDDQYFETKWSYNNLICRNKIFYESCLDYEYMLIYQLDAFIFKDELHYWCNKGYTYIGGFDYNYYYSELINYNCGNINGGLSLRKIQDFYNVLDDIENNRLDTSSIDHIIKLEDLCEDAYFTAIFYMLNKLPPYKDTLKFCYDQHHEFLFTCFYPEIPFGTHYINKSYFIYKQCLKYINY